MTAILKRTASRALLVSFLLLCTSARAQDSTLALKSPDDLMTDVLDLTDPAISIWPRVNTVEVEALSSTIDALKEAYESDRLESDERTRLIETMISESEKDEEIIDAMIDVAKETDDDAEKDRLEDLLDLYKDRRKYLNRIADLRATERELAESRIDYVGELENVLGLAEDLLVAREAGDQAELLATERELIRQSRQLGATLDAVAGKVKDVNGDREKAFEEREKLISTHR
jgi:hypothetical protein